MDIGIRGEDRRWLAGTLAAQAGRTIDAREIVIPGGIEPLRPSGFRCLSWAGQADVMTQPPNRPAVPLPLVGDDDIDLPETSVLQIVGEPRSIMEA
jgi:hypothetical protein